MTKMLHRKPMPGALVDPKTKLEKARKNVRAFFLEVLMLHRQHEVINVIHTSYVDLESSKRSRSKQSKNSHEKELQYDPKEVDFQKIPTHSIKAIVCYLQDNMDMIERERGTLFFFTGMFQRAKPWPQCLTPPLSPTTREAFKTHYYDDQQSMLDRFDGMLVMKRYSRYTAEDPADPTTYAWDDTMEPIVDFQKVNEKGLEVLSRFWEALKPELDNKSCGVIR
ncbi:MAG: hypothetical protein M1828_003026 [Chrysothrix sp. TS-e1954]|nr:MAG: hypothetical protein M1828_003026 [Chrysothrix sp. TS-e1954]